MEKKSEGSDIPNSHTERKPEPEGVQMANRILSNADRAKSLIEHLSVNKANFQHIAETGKINGSLYNDLEDMLTRLMIEYYHKGKRESSPVSVDINRDDELNHLRYELFHITAAHDELLEALKQLYEICPGNYMDYQPYGDALQRATEAISKASPPKQSGE